MLKTLVITTAAAATVSVPLAGVAWADEPSDPGSSNSVGVGAGGVPTAIGEGSGRVPLGSLISEINALNEPGVLAGLRPGNLFAKDSGIVPANPGKGNGPPPS